MGKALNVNKRTNLVYHPYVFHLRFYFVRDPFDRLVSAYNQVFPKVKEPTYRGGYYFTWINVHSNLHLKTKLVGIACRLNNTKVL